MTNVGDSDRVYDWSSRLRTVAGTVVYLIPTHQDADGLLAPDTGKIDS